MTFDQDADQHRLTDAGNAERLVERFGDRLRFVPQTGRWRIYDKRRWADDVSGQILQYAKKTARGIHAEAAVADSPEAARQAARWAERSEQVQRLEAMLRIAQTDPELVTDAEMFDADPWLLNVQNGTLDLRTGQLRAHSPDDLLTKLAPVEFDPAARCPQFEAFLLEIMCGSTGLALFLQRVLGYSLTGSTREQVMFLLYGLGANGKSTLLEIVRALLGEYGAAADFSTFAEGREASLRPDLLALRGARAVVAIESSDGQRLAEGTVKKATGGDPLVARGPYDRHPTTFLPQFKLFLAANKKPEIRATDHGMWRRVRLVPFGFTVPDDRRDPELPAKLRAELPGILNFALEGCLLWQRYGLGTPAEVTAATAEYREEMDVLGGFLSERCELAPRASVLASELYRAYVAWCEENGEKQMKQTAFGRRLNERGIPAEKQGSGSDRKVRRLGIALRGDSAGQYGQFGEKSALSEPPTALRLATVPNCPKPSHDDREAA